jgi:prefoldin beta subunit
LDSVPPQVSEKISKLQSTQAAYDTTVLQHQRVQEELSEVESALETLSQEQQTEVYQFAGRVLVKRDKGKIETELKEKQELLKLRSSALEKQEEKLKEKIKELEDAIRSSMKGQ